MGGKERGRERAREGETKRETGYMHEEDRDEESGLKRCYSSLKDIPAYPLLTIPAPWSSEVCPIVIPVRNGQHAAQHTHQTKRTKEGGCEGYKRIRCVGGRGGRGGGGVSVWRG